MARASSSHIAEVRREYNAAKREYKSAGKKAMGARSGSPAKKKYGAAKREYHQIGKLLGKLTGKKPRKGKRR